MTIGFQVHQASYVVTISLKTVSPQTTPERSFSEKRLSTNHISNLSIIPANTAAQNKSPRKRIFKSPEPEGPSPFKVTQTIKHKDACVMEWIFLSFFLVHTINNYIGPFLKYKVFTV